jgi:tripeptide aminopeptidase
MKMKKNQLIDLFTTICRIDSPTGQEKAMADFVIDFCKKYTDIVRKDKFGNVYVRYGSQPRIFFSAHLDTVEPGRGIKPKISGEYIVPSDDTILGADNKVAVACILQTLKEFAQSKENVAFEVVFTLSEEVGNYGAINFNYQWLKAKVGFCFDSSNPLGAIITASPFYERFDVKIIGKEAHASKPKEANNILYPLRELLKLQKLGQIDRYSLFNIGVINSGYVRNTIPGEINLYGEIRSFYEKNLIKIRNQFIGYLNKIKNKYNIAVIKEFVRENPGYFNKEKKLISRLKQTLTKINLKPVLLPSWGVSDANIFNEKGLTVFNLADATEFSHSKKERIKIKDLLKLKEVIKIITYDLG